MHEFTNIQSPVNLLLKGFILTNILLLEYLVMCAVCLLVKIIGIALIGITLTMV